MPTGLGDEQLWISATNDNTGTSTAFDDQSGNGNDGVAIGAVTVSADTGDGGTYAFNLAAGADGITLPIGIIDGLTEYSYGIWVKLAGGQASSSNIMGGYNSGSADANPTFFVSATDRLRVLGKTDSGSTVSYDIENPATAGVWKHLFFTYSAANGLKTYENGILLNTYTTQTVTGAGTVDFAIGKQALYSAAISLTDDARVYHREITQAEVTHLATSRGVEGAPPTGLGTETGWWCPTLDIVSDGLTNLAGGADATLKLAGQFGVVSDTGSGGTEAWEGNGVGNSGINTGIVPTASQSFSMSCWFNQDSGSTGVQEIMAVEDPATRDYLQVRTNSGVMSTDFNGLTLSGTTDLRGGWHHVALTWNSSDNSAKQYIDGILDASGSMTNGWNQNLGEWEIGSQGRSGGNVWDGLLDDTRIFDGHVLTPAEVAHLATSRGIEGGATFRGVSLRANASYVTDTDNFVVCTPNTATSTNQTDEYNAAQGFGMVAGTYASANFRDRSISLASQLAGMTFQSLNGATFRFDLPDGAGIYKVWFAGIDAASGQATGWRFKDGTGGTEFATLDTTTTTTQYVDINNTRQLASAFDVAGSNYIQRTFTNDHFTIVRDTSLASGNGVISSVWVEKVGGTPTQEVIEHSFSYLQSFPSDTLDLTVQVGCDLYIIGFIEGQVNRYLTGISDDVHGAWDSFDTLYEGINTLPKTWVGRVANHTGGTISITPSFNATSTNLGAIMVLELRGYQFKSETSVDNTARLGTLIAAASPVAVASGDFAIASHSVNASITPTYSEANWNHLTLQYANIGRSFLSTQEVAGSYDFEVTNAGNRYGAGSFALYEPAGGGPPSQYNAFLTHAFKQLFQARLR